ncbi:transposase family protein [Peribacillus muralis]|uniref:transposase family protein n=1 Tax=Peribacillus muralis TaxID=264697 RepID=UPI0037F87073
MLVKELINKIESKEMTIKEIANHYHVSDRTIQNKIKRLGYEWDSKNASYNYVGVESEPLEVDFNTLFDNKQNPSKKVAKSEVIKGEKEVASTSTASKKIVNQKQITSEYDAIDMLLDSKPKAKKVYRGFYFDEDVISIIDSVDNRKKSELVNQALRKVFKDKGLL